jgi:RHS repeat-associated protein
MIQSDQIGDDGIVLQERYAYDKKQRLIYEEKPLGYSAHCTYDSFGFLAKKELPHFCSTYLHDCFGRCREATDAEGFTTKKIYNAYHQPTRVDHPDSSTEEIIYEFYGKPRTLIDTEGVETSFTYDAFGREITKRISFAGEVLSTDLYEYDPFHLIAHTDPEGNRTTYTYDNAGRLIFKQLGEEKTAYQYDPLGRMCLERRGEIYSAKEYDLLNRIIEERKEDALGNVLQRTCYAYDMAGNTTEVIQSIQGKAAITRTIYDSLARPIQITDPLGNKTTFSYEEGPCLKETSVDPLGLKTIKQYNEERQNTLLEIFNAQDEILKREEYSYNSKGNLIEQISQIFDPPRTIVTQNVYDSMGRREKLIEAAKTSEERTSLFGYDRKGRNTYIEKPDGTRIVYTYSHLGYMTSLVSSDSSVDYQYSYDRLGRLLISTDRLTGQMIQREYDPQGRVIQETLQEGITLANSYDSSGRRVTLQLPDHSWIEYGYKNCYLSSVTRYNSMSKKQYVHRFLDYDLSGNVLQEAVIGNLGEISHSYNSCGQKDAISSRYFSQQILERDRVGNILKSCIDTTISAYDYDDLYQVTLESGASSHQYVCDAQHCRLQKDAEHYTVNHLLQIPSHLSYDFRGNAIEQGAFLYKYDALDRLISVELPEKRIDYTYDSDHRRLSKVVHILHRGSWKEVERQYFLYDGQNEIGSFNTSGKIHELRILGLTPHAELSSAIAIELQDRVYVPFHDLQHNVSALIALEEKNSYFCREGAFSEGQLRNRYDYRYSAFGEELSNTPTNNPWRFSSKRTDEETGLVYYGRRYYSAILGRFLTPDPAGFTDGLNLYAFVKNNPLTHIDLYGLFTNDDASSVDFAGFLGPCVQDSRFASVSENSQGTVHYHGGINNSAMSTQQATHCLFETFQGQYTVLGHWIHEDSLIGGLCNVGYEKTPKGAFSFTTTLLSCFGLSAGLADLALKDNYGKIEKAIQYEYNFLKLQASEIEKSGNLRLKQMHMAFSNGGYVFREALKRSSQEVRETAVVITYGTTEIIPQNYACKVYNLIGDKDGPSIVSCGGREAVEREAQLGNVRIIPQTETRLWVGGHYNDQPEYQKALWTVLDREIKGKYEIY